MVTTVQRDLAWFRSDEGQTARLSDLTSTASLTELGRDQRGLAFQPAVMGSTIGATLAPVQRPRAKRHNLYASLPIRRHERPTHWIPRR